MQGWRVSAHQGASLHVCACKNGVLLVHSQSSIIIIHRHFSKQPRVSVGSTPNMPFDSISSYLSSGSLRDARVKELESEFFDLRRRAHLSCRKLISSKASNDPDQQLSARLCSVERTEAMRQVAEHPLCTEDLRTMLVSQADEVRAEHQTYLNSIQDEIASNESTFHRNSEVSIPPSIDCGRTLTNPRDGHQIWRRTTKRESERSRQRPKGCVGHTRPCPRLCRDGASHLPSDGTL